MIISEILVRLIELSYNLTIYVIISTGQPEFSQFCRAFTIEATTTTTTKSMTMTKNQMLLLLLTAIIGAGVGYVVYFAPERPSVQLFNQAINEFAKNAEALEVQYKKNASLSTSSKTLSLGVTEARGDKPLVVNMAISNQRVTLVFAEGDWPLANQSIILEPFIPEISNNDGQVRWKCIAGSVLVRFRSKDCRLGYGILTSELR